MTQNPQSAFIAYPSRPAEVGPTILLASQRLAHHPELRVTPWEELDIAGRFIASEVLASIRSSQLLVADVTVPNFNVMFEIGYAIGSSCRTILVRNSALTIDETEFRSIGIFDTIGYLLYSNAGELESIILEARSLEPLPLSTTPVDDHAPLYVLRPRIKDDADIELIARIKKARLHFRSFDPEESNRLSAREAIENVVRSHGVIVPLLPTSYAEARTHNMRAAFIAGLSEALDKELLILQSGDDPVPLDYRDLVSSYRNTKQIAMIIAEYSPRITARLQLLSVPQYTELSNTLATLELGSSSAENEVHSLARYYLRTAEFQRALRAEVQLIRGRKGSGKTALFFQLRDKLRSNIRLIVLDLKPEGYQLVKFKERVFHSLEEGTKQHLVVAFWEYVLYLEICRKVLEKDKSRHIRDHTLYQLYQSLSSTYRAERSSSEGDFAERILTLTQRIAKDYGADFGGQTELLMLTSDDITRLLYKDKISELRDHLVKYLKQKDGVWILFDNLDKGWPAHGLTPDDVLTIRSLLVAMDRVTSIFRRNEIECNGIIFVRDDIYEHLVEASPDRGKLSEATLDWSDSDLLREVIRRRLAATAMNPNATFHELWREICTSHYDGEDTSEYLIERCLRRPRALIDLIQYCRGHAVNLGHSKILAEDIASAEESFSSDLVENIGYELRDVADSAGDVLYEFIESDSELDESALTEILSKNAPTTEKQEQLLGLLLWYGVLGIVRGDGSWLFIYDVKYNVKRLHAHLHKRPDGSRRYCINPAFWRGLGVIPRNE